MERVYGKIKCKCDSCGKYMELHNYKFKRSKRHYCSVECKNKGITFTKEQKTKICANCGVEFQYPQQNKKQIFCSRKCNNEYRKKTITVKCDECNSEFETIQGKLSRVNNKFCSKECKCKFHSKAIKGNGNPNFNPLLKDADREQKRIINGYSEWRKNVFERDNYTCQCCGDNKGHNLNAHHILNYSTNESLRIEVSNGITLCDKCHRKFHSVYGLKNNDKKQLIEFIENTKVPL